MRIGLISDSYEPYISGVTASMKMLVDGLRDLGHEVYVFTITYKNLPDHLKNDPYVIRFDGITIPKKGLKMFKRVPFVGRHIKTIKKYNLDVLHIHSTSSLGKLGLKAGKKLNIPLIFTAHTIYEQYVHFVSKTLAKLFPRLIRKSIIKLMENYIYNTNITIVPSNKMKDLMLSYGINKDYQVIPTGLYLDDFKKEKHDDGLVDAIKERHGLKETDFICLYLGRISLEKNIDYLIDSFKDIKEDNIKFLIVGSGPYLKPLKRKVKHLNLEDKIIFTGSVSWNQVGLYYRLGDIFINASKSETQGLTYIEALASNLPVLVINDKVIEDLIIDNYNGFIFNNHEELREKIKKVYQDKELLEKLSTQARLSILDYDYQIHVNKVLDLYKSVLKK